MIPDGVFQLQLLATKYQAPNDPPVLVQRPLLRERLDQFLSTSHVLVRAPAGYGKSTLLADWYRRGQHEVEERVWISLDADDEDPALFWAYFMGAFKDAGSSVGDLAFSLLHGSEPVPLQTILATLVNDLVASGINRTVILDDAHLIEDESTLSGLLFLLERLPDTVRLIMGTRSEPSLPLARLRLSGKLRDIDAKDLAFELDEAESYLDAFAGFGLREGPDSRASSSDSDFRALIARKTEGWIAGLQMAALTFRYGSTDVQRYEAFSGSSRQIYDFLLEEVLERQPPETRDFLLATSVLPVLSGALCDRVMDGSGSADLLESLHRANMFVISLDEEQRRYRYHHLFAEVLRARLKRQKPVLLPALHRRAASWFQEAGDLVHAIPHALEADDVQMAADLVECFWRETDRRYQPRTWLDKAQRLPESVFADRPVLNLGMGWAMLDTGKIDRGEHFLDRVDELRDHPAPRVSDLDTYATLEAFLATGRAFIAQARSDWEATKHYAERALELLPEHESGYRGFPLVILALARMRNGDLNGSFRYFIQASDQFEHAGDRLFHHASLVVHGRIRRMQGLLADARILLEDALSVMRARFGEQGPQIVRALLALARVAADEGEADEARSILTQVKDVIGDDADLQRRALIVEAEVLELEGQYEQALATLAQADEHPASDLIPDPTPIPLLRARLHARSSDNRRVEALLRDVSDAIQNNGNVPWTDQASRRLLVQLRLDSENAGTQSLMTAAQCRQEAEKAERDGRLIDQVEWLLLAASILGQGSDEELARLEASRAIEIAHRHHLVRCCVTAPHRPDLVRELVGEIDDEFSRRVLYLMGVSMEDSQDSGPESLTDRESEVLELIAEGLKNQDIADRLFISLATVKRHIANVYAKMEVGSRTEAVRAARLKGWIR